MAKPTLLLLAGGITMVIDQVTKRIALRRGLAVLNRRATFVPVKREAGVALFAVTTASAVVLLLAAPSAPDAAISGLGIALGGAAGNLLDRFRHGAVIDFIRLGRWPAFNVADAAMTAAVILCAWSAWKT